MHCLPNELIHNEVRYGQKLNVYNNTLQQIIVTVKSEKRTSNALGQFRVRNIDIPSLFKPHFEHYAFP